jgi:hypothetical protein
VTRRHQAQDQGAQIDFWQETTLIIETFRPKLARFQAMSNMVYKWHVNGQDDKASQLRTSISCKVHLGAGSDSLMFSGYRGARSVRTSVSSCASVKESLRF